MPLLLEFMARLDADKSLGNPVDSFAARRVLPALRIGLSAGWHTSCGRTSGKPGLKAVPTILPRSSILGI